MKRTLLAALAVTTLIAAPMTALAQPDRDHGGHGDFHRHDEWRKGAHMHKDDWSRGQPVDWRAHHLRHPPRGYEWREVDGNWVMAAAATGLIASVIANSH